MDKRQTVETFRSRLVDLIDRSGLSRSRFASNAGLDRSTLSQLLSDANVRLPRAETIARIATRNAVSIDWLLGLSQVDELGADIVPQLVIEPDAALPADARLERWHEEARGLKIRYVPATLPDQLKTDDVIAYETRLLESARADAWVDVARTHIAHARQSDSEIEVCCARQQIEDFADGSGIWRDLDVETRRQQLVSMRDSLKTEYPTYRCFIFDGRRSFSVPFTVFGYQRAALYVGDMYFVFNSTEHIRVLAGHFDNLIRQAIVQPNEAADFVNSLLDQMEK